MPPALQVVRLGGVLVQQRLARRGQEQEQDGVQGRALQPEVLRVLRVPEPEQVLRQQGQVQGGERGLAQELQPAVQGLALRVPARQNHQRRTSGRCPPG